MEIFKEIPTSIIVMLDPNNLPAEVQSTRKYYNKEEGSRGLYPQMLGESKGTGIDRHIGIFLNENMTLEEAQIAAVEKYIDDMLKANERVRNKLEKGETPILIDLGCGNGALAVALAKQGIAVIGVNVSETQLANAVKLAKEEGVDNMVRFILGDGHNKAVYERIQQMVGKVDGVMAIESLIHMDRAKISPLLSNIIEERGTLTLTDSYFLDGGILDMKTWISKVIMQQGFKIADFMNMTNYNNMLGQLGFNNVIIEDLTPYISPEIAKTIEALNQPGSTIDAKTKIVMSLVLKLFGGNMTKRWGYYEVNAVKGSIKEQ